MCRKEIQSFTTSIRNDEIAQPVYKSSFRLGRVLALFIETGALYIALMVRFVPLVMEKYVNTMCADSQHGKRIRRIW